MPRIRKGDEPVATGRVHKDKKLADDVIRFSFRHFVAAEPFVWPIGEALGSYIEKLFDRLREVSSISLSDFRTNKSRALRAHTHDWPRTTQAAGFTHLNEQLRGCEPWQFCLSANEHGRIHGLLIDEVFYVVWFDPNHALYS